MTTANIEIAVIKKLLSRGVIYPHNHIRLVTLLRCGWKSHERGAVKEAVDRLVKAGLLIWVKKSKKAIALDKRRLKEITAKVGRVL